MALRNGERIGFLLSLMSLEQLQALGIVDASATRRPSHRLLLRLIDERFRRFVSAHRRLMGSIEHVKKLDHKDFDYMAHLVEKNAEGSHIANTQT